MTGNSGRGDRITRLGAWITVAGMVLALVAIIPLFFPSVTMPSWLWLCAVVFGVGLATIAYGFVVSGRERRAFIASGRR